MKIISYYLIDIIYKTVKPSYFKKLEIIKNIKNLMLQVIFIFSDWILVRQIIVSSTHFCCWGKQIFERMWPWGLSNFRLPSAWWQELGGKFWVVRACVKMRRINAFSRNVNSINLKMFHTYGRIKKVERKFNKHSGERDKALRSL